MEEFPVKRDFDLPPSEEEAGLRPTQLGDFNGQSEIKEKLSIYIRAALLRDEPLDHTLFYGPPGLGKTTLAGIIAREMGSSLRVTTGPALEKPGDLAAILTSLRDRDVLFIDEIHRLSIATEEVLYSAMEDYSIHIVVGKGPLARNISVKMPRFTLVGATTRLGLLSSPLRTRFGIIEQLRLYREDELTSILARGSSLMNLQTDPSGLAAIARRSRGTPRVALRLLRRVRDVAAVENVESVDEPLVSQAMEMLGLDERGLDSGDRRILEMMIESFGGGPVGLSTLAAALNEEGQTIEDIYEPYLIQQGFLERTPRGRKVTSLAYEYLGYPQPPSSGSDSDQQQPLKFD